ncbi:MAG: alpha/beta hydrolase, partial [Myxococcales bacterium]|nr:alpha/beta hydrolase [Myxococcales bacterium]
MAPVKFHTVLSSLSLALALVLGACASNTDGPDTAGGDNNQAGGSGNGSSNGTNNGSGNGTNVDPLAAAPTLRMTANEVVESYRHIHYEFRQPAEHGVSRELTVTQHVEVLIPPGADQDSPVFFLLDNEQDSTVDGLMKTTALLRFFGSKMIYVAAEHRGYGQSLSDSSDQSVPTYVSHEQAVEDAHAVIQTLKKEYRGPWMSIGYSYGGALVTELGARHPEDSDVFVASSAPFLWTSGADHYEGYVRERLGDETFKKAAAVMEMLQPTQMFSPKWENREFMEGVWLGLTQYSWAQPYMGAVSVVLDKPLDEILSTSRTLDESVAGGLATLYAKTRARLRVSREEALAEDYTWRVYHFQQCSDFGVFFTSPSHDGVFLRTLEEHEAECVQMFGEKNVLALDSGAVHWDLFDRIPSYQKANHPKLVYVRGGNDPWQVHGPDAPNWTPRVH